MKQTTNVMILAALIAALTSGCTRQGSGSEQGDGTASTSVVKLNESNFDAEIGAGVVLVDFWATWCGPCKMQAPIVAQVAERVEGKAKVAKLDVDSAPKIAQRFGVEAIPTLIVFKNGKPGKRFVGLTKAEPLVSAIHSAAE